MIGIAQFAMSFPVAKIEDKPSLMANFRGASSITSDMRKNYPGMDIFAKNEQQYISFWTTWLQQYKAQSSASQ